MLNIHCEYVLKIKHFIKENNLKMRLPNFPENIIKEYINKIEKKHCIKSQSGGDLEVYEIIK